ncbi:cation diffusion facilitator family transporter [Muribaculum intestinale]|uniref:cation diffusion facilitator family transporter n=1 Tax=Muribaculum intestinale TaxID=1796646 RepID=UPI00272F1AAC|nr:cation diffusion facilitator family transporter [Muribaculum intestinale]
MTSSRERDIYRVTIIGSIVNLLLLIFKFIAGFAGHSSAMIADAVHSLSDFFSDIVVIVMVRQSAKPEDKDHDYGHGKYETLASLIVGLMLAIVGLGIFYNGVSTTIAFFNGESIGQPTWIALIAAIVSIFAKEGIYRYTIYKERAIHSSALIANAWHHRSDALTSVAALVGIGGAMILGSKWAVLDPIAAAVVSIFIIKAAYDLIKPNLDELLEKALSEEQKQGISKIVLDTPGVVGMHRLRTRRVGNNLAIELHIKMDGNMSLRQAHEIATEVEKRLKQAYGNDIHTGIHMEPFQR